MIPLSNSVVLVISYIVFQSYPVVAMTSKGRREGVIL